MPGEAVRSRLRFLKGLEGWLTSGWECWGQPGLGPWVSAHGYLFSLKAKEKGFSA